MWKIAILIEENEKTRRKWSCVHTSPSSFSSSTIPWCISAWLARQCQCRFPIADTTWTTCFQTRLGCIWFWWQMIGAANLSATYYLYTIGLCRCVCVCLCVGRGSLVVVGWWNFSIGNGWSQYLPCPDAVCHDSCVTENKIPPPPSHSNESMHFHAHVERTWTKPFGIHIKGKQEKYKSRFCPWII